METKKIVTELTPELADKIYKDMRRRIYDEQVSKKAVLHHLKQLKAQMGKLKNEWVGFSLVVGSIDECMQMIDKKIAKINTKAI